MAFDFDALKPEAKRAAFAKMDRAAGRGKTDNKDGKSTGSASSTGKTSSSAAASSPASGSTNATSSRARTRMVALAAGAYQKLARSRGAWVSIADLRRQINKDSTGGLIQSSKLDEVLREESKAGRMHLAPMSNRKALTADDHENAIRIGGDATHLIMIPDTATGRTKPGSKTSSDAASSTTAGASVLAQVGGALSPDEARRRLRAQDRARRAQGLDATVATDATPSGRITLRDAAVRMFGQKEAARRIAAHEARRTKKRR